MRAAERALPLMRGGQTLRFAMLPDGEDPDSYLRRHGAEALAAVLSKAHTLSQMIWRLETQGRRFETPEARAALSRRLARAGPARRRSRPAVEPDGPVPQPCDGAAAAAGRGWRQRAGAAGGTSLGWDGVGACTAGRGHLAAARRPARRAVLPLLRSRTGWTATRRSLRAAASRSAISSVCARKSSHGSSDACQLLTRRHSQRHLQRYGLGRLLDQFAGHLTQQLARRRPADARMAGDRSRAGRHAASGGTRAGAPRRGAPTGRHAG